MAAARATKAGGQLFVHGLTGGIATGKTHACQVLQGLGAQVLNGDLLAHQCYLPGQPAHAAIRRTFGSGVFAPDGTVDRRRLGKVVFEAPDQLAVLNGIMFPATEAKVREEVARLGSEGHRWVVVEAALLLEAKWDAWMDTVWCMIVSPEVARARIMERNGLSEEEAEQRIRSQMSNAARTARASVAIDSSGPKPETAAKLTKAAVALRQLVREEYGFDLVAGRDEMEP